MRNKITKVIIRPGTVAIWRTVPTCYYQKVTPTTQARLERAIAGWNIKPTVQPPNGRIATRPSSQEQTL